MKRVAFHTLGCKVNQYETEAISEIFRNNGYKVVDFDDFADVYVINTCTVTNLSDRKSRQIIRRARKANESAVVAVIGCYAQTAPEEVGKIPGVNVIVGTRDRNRICELINEVKFRDQQVNVVDDIMEQHDFEELPVSAYKDRTRAYLKIQEGCSQFCSYCIIPYARGPVRSRPPADVIREVEKLAQNGFKEVILTGIHVASYGKDLTKSSLLEIIKTVHEVNGIERIRLGSVEPKTITDEFIAGAVRLHKLCPHYHVSLQSGCDSTLKRMNRKYTTGEYRKVIGLLRSNIKYVSITTDIIVGFPGETEEEFIQSYRFAEEMGFSKMHVFKFSPRKGTPAAGYPNQIDGEVKEGRSNKMITLSSRMQLAFNNSFTGCSFDVMYEQEAVDRPGYMEGLTPNYIRLLTLSGGGIRKGDILTTEITGAEEDFVIGKVSGTGGWDERTVPLSQRTVI